MKAFQRYALVGPVLVVGALACAGARPVTRTVVDLAVATCVAESSSTDEAYLASVCRAGGDVIHALVGAKVVGMQRVGACGPARDGGAP